MNSIDKQYQSLLQDILDNGVQKGDRTGTGTISVFGRQIRHKMSEGFPLLTTKKMAWNSIVTELLWFLRGDTNIKFLLDYDCHIWDGDAYKNYQLLMIGNEPEKILSMTEFIDKIKTDDTFAKNWGELGPIYGKQWRDWGGTIDTKLSANKDENGFYNYITTHNKGIDQIQNLINELKTNPDSRRLIVSAWNIDELDQMILPPCHYGFQLYTRELSVGERLDLASKTYGDLFEPFDFGLPAKVDHNEIDKLYPVPKRAISLMWNQRSVDTFLGLPFNIASYALLLEIIAKEVDMIPDELVGNLGDVHLYSNHIEQAKEQIGRDLTDEERYNKWFNNNVESGMERFFDPNYLPDFDDPYYEPTPKRTREPFELPKLWINNLRSDTNTILGDITKWSVDDFKIENYKSHPAIKAPLSN